jgi:hypothetical protein
MSHPVQFRVYFPKYGKPIYTVGMDEGEAIFLDPKTGRFQKIFDPLIAQTHGQPIIQMDTDTKDKHNKPIFEGDVIYFHKFKWIGVVMYDEDFGENFRFRCQMEDGFCSLTGMPVLGEVILNTFFNTEEKVKLFLNNSKSIFGKYDEWFSNPDKTLDNIKKI